MSRPLSRPHTDTPDKPDKPDIPDILDIPNIPNIPDGPDMPDGPDETALKPVTFRTTGPDHHQSAPPDLSEQPTSRKRPSNSLYHPGQKPGERPARVSRQGYNTPGCAGDRIRCRTRSKPFPPVRGKMEKSPVHGFGRSFLSGSSHDGPNEVVDPPDRSAETRAPVQCRSRLDSIP